MQTDTYLKIWG